MKARGREKPRPAIRVTRIQTPIGPMIAAATEEAICLLEFDEPPWTEERLVTLCALYGRPILVEESSLLGRLRAQLRRYFEGKLKRFTLPLDSPGSPFQRKVWGALRRIPFGETRSYAEVARAVGRPAAARAVGNANGSNRIAILIPCHRVIAAGARLGGYGGGLWRKQHLLALEGFEITPAPARRGCRPSRRARPRHRP